MDGNRADPAIRVVLMIPEDRTIRAEPMTLAALIILVDRMMQAALVAQANQVTPAVRAILVVPVAQVEVKAMTNVN